MSLHRHLRHLSTTQAVMRRAFTDAVLADIEHAIQEVERRHGGEIRFVVEGALSSGELRRKLSPRERALQVFAALGVWDTEANNGVLIYLLIADRDVEIVADRGIAARVSAGEWETICRDMEQHFRKGAFRAGSLAGIQRVGELLGRHFPRDGNSRNELPDQPVLL